MRTKSIKNNGNNGKKHPIPNVMEKTGYVAENTLLNQTMASARSSPSINLYMCTIDDAMMILGSICKKILT